MYIIPKTEVDFGDICLTDVFIIIVYIYCTVHIFIIMSFCGLNKIYKKGFLFSYTYIYNITSYNKINILSHFIASAQARETASQYKKSKVSV